MSQNNLPSLFYCFSEDEDDERQPKDTDTEPKNSKKMLSKVKWSREEVMYSCFSLLSCLRF